MKLIGSHSLSLQTESRHDANFALTGGTPSATSDGKVGISVWVLALWTCCYWPVWGWNRVNAAIIDLDLAVFWPIMFTACFVLLQIVIDIDITLGSGENGPQLADFFLIHCLDYLINIAPLGHIEVKKNKMILFRHLPAMPKTTLS